MSPCIMKDKIKWSEWIKRNWNKTKSIKLKFLNEKKMFEKKTKKPIHVLFQNENPILLI